VASPASSGRTLRPEPRLDILGAAPGPGAMIQSGTGDPEEAAEMAVPTFRSDGPAEAPVLVLLSSLGTDARMWDPLLGVLTEHFSVLRPEHPGHGGSPAPSGACTIEALGTAVVELLDHVGVERASVCGVSLGGMVALWLAEHHPNRVDRLVLAASAPSLPPAGSWTERAAAVRAGGTGPLADMLLPRWFTPGFTDRAPEVADLVRAMLANCAPEGYAACCEAIAEADLSPDLDKVSAPTLLLAGAEDPVTPPTRMAELVGRIAGAAMVVLPGTAHLAAMEQPRRFAAAVVDHLLGPLEERGRAVRAAVLGEAHVARSEAAADPVAVAFGSLLTRSAWGEVWTRPGLDRATRSCITLAVLIALGRTGEIPPHVRGALRNGLRPDQVGEVLLHTAAYAGIPAANEALPSVLRALAEPDA